MSSLYELKPLPAFGALAQVSDAELARYAALIYERTGIRVSPQKKTLLSNRLRRRLRQTGIANFDEYFRHLKQLPAADPEWDAFLQEITTHETYLFRDESQWEWFRTVFLPEKAAAAAAGGKRKLRIWSAACSTGDEPVTIACSIATYLPNFQQWSVQIVGTDIGTGALEQARSGVFGQRAMRLVPAEIRRACFVKGRDEQSWRVQPAVAGMITFRQHNLMEPLRERPFDLVFLKNVLIYFDAKSKQTVIDHIRAVLPPGGLLITGAAEGVADLVRDFRRLQPWLYCRNAD